MGGWGVVREGLFEEVTSLRPEDGQTPALREGERGMGSVWRSAWGVPDRGTPRAKTLKWESTWMAWWQTRERWWLKNRGRSALRGQRDTSYRTPWVTVRDWGFRGIGSPLEGCNSSPTYCTDHSPISFRSHMPLSARLPLTTLPKIATPCLKSRSKFTHSPHSMSSLPVSFFSTALLIL